MESNSKIKYPHLFSPLKVRGKTYKNRMICAPIGGIAYEDHHSKPDIRNFIKYRHPGGAAGYMIGETPISPESARGFVYYDYSDPVNMSALREYVQAVKEQGPDTILTIEQMHPGEIIVDPDEEHPAVGPTGHARPDGKIVQELSEADMEKICRDFAAIALHCKTAGFDGVAPHLAHGWLFSQFLSPLVNKRTDKFGGSIENRSRFAVMVVRAIRETCGEDFLIECRVSGDEHIDGSYSLDDMCEFCRFLSQYADIIHVSAGHYRDPMNTLMMSSMYDEHGCNANVAARIKREVSIPVAVVGGINSPEIAEEIIASGKADLVVLGRQTFADPMFPAKAASGRGSEIRNCFRCMRCFPGPIDELGGPETLLPGCSASPLLEQKDTEFKPAAKQKRVLIVGGGVAGMQAAQTASDRGHSVVLVEKNRELGGILNYARHDPDKLDLKRFADAMAAETYARPIDVRLNTQLTDELLAAIAPDIVIAAIGSSPLLPPIPGLGDPSVIFAVDAYDPEIKLGERVIILGGGQVGCETAIHLSRGGKKVTLVEMRGELAPDAYRLHNKRLNALIEADVNIECLLGAACVGVSIDAGGCAVEIEQNGARRTLKADTPVAALGMKANPTDLVKRLAANCEYYAIGDCVRAAKIYDALKEGYLAASAL